MMMTREIKAARRIVLVVDDSPESLGALMETLEAAAITALVARDGASALDLLGRVRPDLILLDASMPGLDGFETCRRIKARPEFAAVPVVFLTGRDGPDDMLSGLRAGGVDYVLKPVNQSVLLERIRIHIANADMVSEARAALDATGPGVFALAPDLTVAWASVRVQERLGAGLEQLPDIARAQLFAWAAGLPGRMVSQSERLETESADGALLEFEHLGRTPGGDLLVQVRRRENIDEGALLSRELSLSPREGEVLAWIAKGKSNKDVAAILGLSARTVTKHLEQIFQKLGAENRTSAALAALRVLRG